jgi:sorbitol-specific phosphotransferase system component IIC
MDIREKALYHQIHPVKLFTDVSTSFVSLFLIWQHNQVAGLLIGIIPSIVISLLVIRFASLERIKQSPFGRYVARYMTNKMQAIRLLGQVVGWFGA